MALLILSVVGSDRPGLTQALAAAVLSAGANWLESHLSQLGGLYVGSVLVEVEADQVMQLREAVDLVDAEGLAVRIVSAGPTADAAGQSCQLNLVGQDRPGIVNIVTDVLKKLDANIEAFDTRVAPEAHSGSSLFHMEVRLRLAPSTNINDLQRALESISADVMVDISVGLSERAIGQ